MDFMGSIISCISLLKTDTLDAMSSFTEVFGQCGLPPKSEDC
jgi:hypothetical protein